jgi:hypothetical protein
MRSNTEGMKYRSEWLQTMKLHNEKSITTISIPCLFGYHGSPPRRLLELVVGFKPWSVWNEPTARRSLKAFEALSLRGRIGLTVSKFPVDCQRAEHKHSTKTAPVSLGDCAYPAVEIDSSNHISTHDTIAAALYQRGDGLARASSSLKLNAPKHPLEGP